MRKPIGREPDALLDSLHEGVQVIDHEFRYVYVNPSAAKHGKSNREKLVGQTMMACYPGIEATPMFRMLTSCLVDRSSHVIENAFLFPDGELRWFELRIEPVADGACVLSLDVTDRKVADAALRVSDEHHRRAEHERELRAAVEVCIATIDALKSAASSASHGVPISEADAFMEELRAFGQLRPCDRRGVAPSRILTAFETRLVRDGIEHSVGALPSDVVSSVIEVDEDAIIEVLVAIVRNLRDRYAARGAIRIGLETMLVSVEDARIERELAPCSHVVFSVAIEGRIDATFDTVFHLRSVTSDAPLGLAGARGIVRQNGGVLRVLRGPGLGMTFEVLFPTRPQRA